MKTIITVLTCKRRTDYLTATLRSLDKEGSDLCDEKWVVGDGPESVSAWSDYSRFGNWLIRTNEQRTGHTLAMWRCFMLAAEREADWLLFCEDDIVMAPNAVELIVDLSLKKYRLDPTIGFVTFYDHHRLQDGAAPGLYVEPCRSKVDGWTIGETGFRYFHCTQCILVPRHSIDYLLTVNPLSPPTFPFRGFHAGDAAFGDWMAESRWPNFGIRVPCLADHRGDVSEATPNAVKLHRGNNFAGERDEVWNNLHSSFYKK